MTARTLQRRALCAVALQVVKMKLYLFPPSPRVLGIVALKNHLALDCEVQLIDLGRGDQLTPQYVALNPNKKMPTLGFVRRWGSQSPG
jgi:glutathione S-transferase